MNKDDIGVAPFSYLYGGTRADCYHVDLYAALLFEHRQYVAEEARILCARRGCTAYPDIAASSSDCRKYDEYYCQRQFLHVFLLLW